MRHSHRATETPAMTAGRLATATSASCQDWKLATSSSRITNTASSNPARRAPSNCVHRLYLPAQRDADLGGRRTHSGQCSAHGRRRGTQVVPSKIGGHGDHARHVVAVVFAHHGPPLHRGHVAQQRPAGGSGYRHVRHVLDRADQRLGHLHLHLVGHAVGRRPVHRLREAAGGGRRCQRTHQIM